MGTTSVKFLARQRTRRSTESTEASSSWWWSFVKRVIQIPVLGLDVCDAASPADNSVRSSVCVGKKKQFKAISIPSLGAVRSPTSGRLRVIRTMVSLQV